MRVTSFSIKGIGPFKKEVSLNIAKGLTCIYGNNTKNGNANAVGKTLLSSVIRDTMYSTDKDGGCRSVHFVHKGRKFEVTRGASLKVFIDGEDKTKRTKTETAALLAKAWPLTELDYLTHGILDLQPHPLLRGSAAERRAFFSKFFKFSDIDNERKVINEKLNLLAKDRARLEEVDAALAALPEVSKPQKGALQAAKDALEKAADYASRHADSHLLLKLKSDLEGIDVETFSQVFKKLKAQKHAKQNAQEATALYQAYLEERAAYRKALSSTKTQEKDLEVLESSYEKYSAAKALAEDDLEEEIELKVVKELSVSRDEVVAKLSRVKEQLAHVKKHRGGLCYACGSSVKVDPAKLAQDEKRYELLLEKAEQNERAVRHNDRAVHSNAKAKERNAAVLKARQVVKLHKDFAHDFKVLRGLKKPAKVEPPGEVTFDEEKFKRYAELSHFQDRFEEALQARKVKAVDVQAYASEVARLEAQHNRFEEVSKRRGELEARKAKLSVGLHKEADLKIIKAAYNDKGMKAMAGEILTAHMLKSINRLASSIFEDYNFGFDLSKYQFTVSRNGKAHTSVRKLSGAETKLFSFIVALSLLQFVPEDKRLNVLILDEPAASFSEETKKLFGRLLQEMLKVVESIIVVTPGLEEYEGAKNYTVERSGAGSVLREGRP